MLAILVLLTIANCWLTTALEPNGFKLELVQVLFRHGDRTIEGPEIYPTLPYNASTYEPFGYGQLTNVGKRREYQIGQVLRNQYSDFLGTTYKPTEVFAYSTDYDRTKMSLQLVLTGLYPPNKLLTWNENINWIPFSTSYNRIELDFLQTSLTCPLYKELNRNAVQSSGIKKKLAKYNDTINHVTRCAGYSSVKTPMVAFAIFNTIECHRSMGLPFPNWLSKKQYNELKEVVAILYESMSLTNAMRKLSSGATLKRLVENISNQGNKGNNRKIYLYSAHDKNVMSFIKSHRLRFPKIAPFGTAVFVEKLRGPDNEVYVRLLVWTGEDEQLVTLKLDRCEEICPLSKYLEIIKPVLPDGEGTECSLENVDETILGDIANYEDPTNIINTRFVKTSYL